MGRERAQEPFLVTHHGRLYDIGPFLSRHPGGIAHLEPYRGRSVTALLQAGGHGGGDAASALEHSEAARYILKEYRLYDQPHEGTDNAPKNGLNGLNGKNGLNGINGLNGYNGKKNGITGMNGLNGKHNGLSGTHDPPEEELEDLEALVDWDKPMLGQVASLGPKYVRWVNLPVDRKLKLFGPPWLEELSKARWYYIPIVWLPVLCMFLAMHFSGGHSATVAALGVVLGVVNWSLLEYSLHRWFFHLPPGESPTLITMHFLIHGLHHKVPFDSMRLVFPPTASAVLGVILYSAYSLLLPNYLLNCVAAGITIGYISYDLFHYYLHFGSPKEPSHMYMMKRYHNQHHFSHHDLGYGITSPFWDKIFGTKIILQKLAKTIKW